MVESGIAKAKYSVTPDASTHDPRPEYLAQLIDSTGLEQEPLAELLGCSDRAIRMWLAGDRPFPYLVQFALECLVFDV